MAISIDWGTKIITIPQSYLTFISGSLYQLDVNQLRLDLKDLEDNEDGMAFEKTHNHNTQVVLSGVTYARSLEIINGYTITFENGNYTVVCTGANHNLADVKNVNSVSLIIGNAAGLISVSTGSGLSSEEHDALMAVPDDVWTKTIESTLTAEKILRITLAALAGKRQGLGTSLAEYVAQNGTTPRITLDNFDENGNGTPELNGDL